MTDFRRVGNSGLAVSLVGLGCNNLGRAGTAAESEKGSAAVVHAALDAGITLFDVADSYGKRPGLSEELLGKALAGRRGEVVVATKFGLDLHGANGPDWDARGSRRYIIKAAEASLRRLNSDWIDLYQFHAPDPLTPIEETLAALDELVRSGKVRYIGHSNRAGWQIAEAEFTARIGGYTPFISAQNQYSLLDRRAEQEVIPAAEAYGISLLPYLPLANGLLTGKYRNGAAPAGSRLSRERTSLLAQTDWDQLERFSTFAAERGVSEVEAAFSWLAAQPVIASIIAGATSAEQVHSNVRSTAWTPTAEDLAALNEIFPRVPRAAT